MRTGVRPRERVLEWYHQFTMRRAPRAKPSAVSERFVYVALFISNKTRLMASSASSPLLRHAFLEHFLDD